MENAQVMSKKKKFFFKEKRFVRRDTGEWLRLNNEDLALLATIHRLKSLALSGKKIRMPLN